jgi:AsmA-like C-terminal region
MTDHRKHRFWRKCRVYFRRLRISVWLVALMLLCAVLYLDLVGLPDFVKRPLLDGLRARGVNLEFSNLRLNWHHGLVAEDVRFGQANQTAGPRLSAKEVSLQLNLPALAGLRFQVDGLSLREGRLEWPADETNAPLRVLNIENIETRLRLLPGDEWSLDDFRARFAGAQFSLTADITNASAIRNWTFLHAARPAATNIWPQRLRRLAATLETISFSSPPDLRLVASGDARDLQSFSARLTVSAPDADTPWGKASQVLLTAHLFPATSNDTARGEIKLEAEVVQTQWGEGRKLQFTTDLAPLSNPPPADASLAWWTNALPWKLDWQCELAELRLEKISADEISCAGLWRAPQFAVTNLQAKLGGGEINAGAGLDVVSREAQFNLVSDADPNAVAQLLTPKTRSWLAKYSWESRPHLNGGGGLTLPEWTNRHPDWRGEVRPTLRLGGEFAVTNGAYMGIHADWARSHVSYTNMVWHLPDLEVGRPEGTMRLAHREDDRTKDFHWHVQGPIDPRLFRPLLATNQLRGFDLVTFNGPLTVDGDVWGRLYEHERIGFQLRVAATNFAFRGQSVDTFESAVRYTNRFLELIEPHLTRGAQLMNASGVAVDFTAQRIYFTNGFGMAEPQMVANAIGPKVGHVLEPYRFALPPVVHVDGYAPLKGSRDADLHFAVDGGPFEWLKFKVPHIAGDVYWRGETLLLTNVQAGFYEGTGEGSAFFAFRPGQGQGCDFNFSLAVTNADLHLLMSDVAKKTNRLEGLLTGKVTITDATSTNIHSWNGSGSARLRDGFIWEIPFFGVLSPVLDGIVPGLGNSRVTEGRGSFFITNGVVYSDSLSFHSPMMRLQYKGTADFNGRVNARVEAELFRDAGGLGRFISVVLWPVTKLMEYEVKGTMSKPKVEPVYIPKLLFLPLHPFRTLGELFPNESGSTNAPPALLPLDAKP